MRYLIPLSAIVVLLAASVGRSAERALLPVGVAKIDITPRTPARMYGYASRTMESESVAGRLSAGALALGDDTGDGPALLLCVDCGSVPADIRNAVYQRLSAQAKLRPERFVLCNSHCHSAPNLKGRESITDQPREHLDQYATLVTDRLVEVSRAALAARSPAHLDLAAGQVGFAANRRVLKDGKWSGFGAVPNAQADRSLPLLRVTAPDGRVRAVIMNYACHNTTLRGNFKQIHGDWAGCAQQAIERDHPGVSALITIGCGADSDPCPHGTTDLCEKHGRAMANEVSRLLAGPFRPVAGPIYAKSAVLEFAYADPPPVASLAESAKKSYALQRLLARLERGEKPIAERYPITVWGLGDELAMVFLSNEVVVDYALRLKRELAGNRLWVSAYSNDVSYYVASDRLIREGGYEVNNSLSTLVSYGRPETVQPTVETRIIQQVRDLLPPTFREPTPLATK